MDSEDRPTPISGRGRGEEPIEELSDERAPVEVTQSIAAPPAAVFAYLTDPEKFATWMGVGVELDPRPGGRYRIDIDGEHVASGEYREVEPPRRVLMTWGWEGSDSVPPGSTMIEITLTPDGPGTVLRLRHTGLPSDEERQSHNAGWKQYTGALASQFK